MEGHSDELQHGYSTRGNRQLAFTTARQAHAADGAARFLKEGHCSYEARKVRQAIRIS